MQKNALSMSVVQCLTVIFLLLLLPVLSYSSQLMYTIQTGSFLRTADAQKQFDYGVQELDENKLDYLRIEKVGKFYTVRLGKFNEYSIAEQLRMAIAPEFPDAAVMKAYIKDERIIKSYTDSLPADKENNREKSKSSTVPERTRTNLNKKADKNEEEGSSKEALLKRVVFTERNFNSLSHEQPDEQQDEGIAAITMPSADIALSFIHPGRIAKVYVSEGDLVKAGQILMQQDDDAERAQLSRIREKSRDRTRIEAEKARLDQKKVYLERLQWASQRGSATELEVEDAKLEVSIAEFSLKAAEFEHEQNNRAYREAEIRVNNMSLKSPISGRVEKVNVDVGESIDGLLDIVRIIRTNPLWIDVHLPLELGRSLSLDQTASIYFPANDQPESEGRIIFISTVADAASSTIRARIEVPNKLNRPAGEHVSVRFSTP